MKKTLQAADLFCGAGGTTTGMLMACRDLNFRLELLAVNHWPLAIQTHLANHPWARHICSSLMPIEPASSGELFEGGVDAIDPRKAVPSGKLDILVASPECTHHSIARGGRPRSDQSRATPWCILRWADALRPDSILIENVPEFRTWGPLDAKGKPIAAEKGKIFSAFLNALDSLGYTVEHRVLCAADYGDATTRRRLFIQARRGRVPVTWPSATHTKDGEGETERWRAAREIIDWNLPGKSIFRRKKPLVPRTIERIAAGLKRFCGENAEPFLIVLNGYGKRGGVCVRSVDSPIPTQTTGNHIGLVEPFLVAFHGGRDGDRRHHALDDPLPTQDCSNRYGLCEPFLTALQPYVIPQQSKGAPRSVKAPLPTVCTKGTIALVQPYLVKYYGTARSRSIDVPLDTVTTKDRFGLVEPVMIEDHEGNRFGLDIRFRMLQPHELAAATGFPEDYEFAGTKGQKVKQIGNAVPTHTACALTKALVA